jgi:hypothetical protein
MQRSAKLNKYNCRLKLWKVVIEDQNGKITKKW